MVLSDENQLNECTNSIRYKRYHALTYATVFFSLGLFLTIMIFMIFSFYIDIKSQYKWLICIILVLAVTYTGYTVGYNSADGSDLKLQYDMDIATLKERDSKFKTREDNLSDLIQDRKREKEVYEAARYSRNNGYRVGVTNTNFDVRF
jgi:uncharacterized protein YacL